MTSIPLAFKAANIDIMDEEDGLEETLKPKGAK